MTERTPHRRRVRLSHVVAIVAAGAGVAFAAPALAAPLAAQGVIVNSGGTGAIAGSYIVVLKDSASLRSSSVSATARTLVDRRGGTVQHVYQSALTGFSAKMDEASARQLAADPAVAVVEQDHAVRMADTQANPPSWGLDRIDQRNLPLDNSYTYPSTAANVHAYIIDTGILLTHVAFGGKAVSGHDFVDNDNDATDCQGHGTHVAGTVGSAAYGVAKAVSLVAVRVLDCQGSGTDAGVIAGIDWVTANAIKPAVANMSLGGGASPTLDAAVVKSINSGVTYGIAAGNGDIFGNAQDACGTSPARVPAAITVGATQNNDAKASFSNFGTCLDIFAPGVNITSAWGAGGNNTATNTISGTSMATPHVVGAAALILAANPTFTPAQVRDKMVADATSGKVTSPGTGSPNKLLFVGGGTTPPPPPPPPPGKYFENTGDVQIPDYPGAAVTSSIAVTGITGNAPATLKVGVSIKHTYIGDLVVDLVAPDGSVYNLHNRAGGSTDNLDQTYTVNASSEVANGTWKLRVQDKAAIDTGYIDTFSLQF